MKDGKSRKRGVSLLDGHREPVIEGREKNARERRLLCAAFGLTFFMWLLVCALRGIAPFGNHILLFSDSYTQYICFWAYFRDLLLGKQDLFYALEKTVGGNVMGLFAYYGASPFNLLYLLAPVEKLPLVFHLIVLLKLSCCSLTLGLYFKNTGGLYARDLLLTAAYAFCAYTVSYFWSAMWLDAVILLPLVALGLRRIFSGGRVWLYLWSLAGSIVCNYYTGYMLCLFSVLYALVLAFNRAESWKKLPWRETGAFTLASLAAGGLSAGILLPALLSMEGGKAKPFGALFSWYTYSTSLKILERICPERAAEFDGLVKYVLLVLLLAALILAALTVWLLSSRRVRPWVKAVFCAGLAALALAYAGAFEEETPFLHKLLVGFSSFYEIMDGQPNLWTGLLPLVLALAYFLNKKIPGRERWSSLALLLVLLFSMRLYVPNLIWHGFTENNSFNYRYSFLLSFCLLTLAKRELDSLESFRLRHGAFALGAAALLVFLAKRAYPPLAEDWYYALALAAVLGFSAALYALPRLGKKGRTALWTAVAAAHLLSLAYPLYVTMSNLEDHFREPYSSYQNMVLDGKKKRAAVENGRGDLFRARLGGGMNGPMLIGYNGLTHFSSTESKDAISFLSAMGIDSSGVWASADDGSTRAFDSLMGLRYLTGGTYTGEFETLGDSGVYENQYALPLAFLSTGTGGEDFSLGWDPFENLNRAYRALCPELGLDIFTPARFQRLGDQGLIETEHGYVTAPGESAGRIDYAVWTEKGDPLYFYFRGGAFQGVEVWLNETRYASPAYVYDWHTAALGAYAPGEELRLSLRTSGRNPELAIPDSPLLYTESGEALAAYRTALCARPVTMESGTDSHFLFRADAGQGQSLIFTVPWEKNWHVTVDGAPAETEKALGFLMAVPLAPGEHTIELRYVPPGLRAGLTVSALAGVALAAAWALGRRKRK